MLELNFDPFPVLTTENLDLRRINENDVEEVFFFRSDPVMLRYLDRAPAKSPGEAREWIASLNAGIDNNQQIAWGITLKNSDSLIGVVTLWNIQKEHYRSELGYLLHPSQQGKGLMNEALNAVLDYGFSTMNIHSIEANVNPANQPSIRLLERNNFMREAYHKENFYYNGTFFDSAIYSLISPIK